MKCFSECVDGILGIWKGAGLKQQTLYDVWELLASDQSPLVAARRDQILKDINDFWKWTSDCHQNMIHMVGGISFDCSNVRTMVNRWRRGTAPQLPNLASFAAVVCYCMLYGREKPCSLESAPPSEKLLEYCCGILQINIKSELFVKELHEVCTTTVVFGAMCSCCFQNRTEFQNGEHTFKDWVCGYMENLGRRVRETSKREAMKNYYERLWTACCRMELRDIVDSLTGGYDICDLYVFPEFSFSGVPRQSPVMGKKRFYRMVSANSGAGKSSLVQAVVLTSILGPLKDFESQCLPETAGKRMRRYESLKEQFACQREYFPVMIRGTDLNAAPDGGYLLRAACGVKDGEIDRFSDLVEMAEREGRLLLIIDALDEIADGERDMFLRQLDHFLSGHKKASLLITTRLIEKPFLKDYAMFGDMEQWTLKLFDDGQILELIRRWYDHVITNNVKNNCEQIYQYFISNPYLHKLSNNPYMFSQALYIRSFDLNANPNTILSNIIARLIVKRWPMERYRHYNVTAEYMRRILSCIAWEMVDSDEHRIEARELSSRFQDAAGRLGGWTEIPDEVWRTMVNEMNARAGLLIPGYGGYTFQLSMIECYLAAEWMLEILREKFDVRNGTQNPYEIEAEFDRLLPEQLEPEYWQDILIMFFSIAGKYNKKDYYSPVLYKILARRLALTLNSVESAVIINIFASIVRNVFGFNSLTDYRSRKYNTARSQMLRMITQMAGERLEEWTIPIVERTVFQEEFELLVSEDLISEKEGNERDGEGR